MSNLPFCIDWDTASKLIIVKIDRACAMVFDLDLAGYQYLQQHYHEYLADSSMGEYYAEKIRCAQDAVVDRLIKKQKLLEVAINHEEAGNFIEVQDKPISYEEAQKRRPDLQLSKDQSYFDRYVKLAEFGTWAKSVGYKLPSLFPTQEFDSNKGRTSKTDSYHKQTLPAKHVDKNRIVGKPIIDFKATEAKENRAAVRSAIIEIVDSPKLQHLKYRSDLKREVIALIPGMIESTVENHVDKVCKSEPSIVPERMRPRNKR